MTEDHGLDREDLVRALFDAGADGILIVGEDGRVALANAACERLLGVASGGLAGRTVEDLVPEPFAQELREAFTARPPVRPTGRGGPELFARHADGRDIPVDISVTPLTVGGRRLAGCSIRDMRQHVHGPESLRVQTTALKSAANGIVITDRAGHCGEAGPLGYPWMFTWSTARTSSSAITMPCRRCGTPRAAR